MGQFAFASGLSKDLYDACYKFFGRIPGGLAVSTIVASAGFKEPVGLSKFIFGAVFPVGLIIVVLAGSELFTGNVMFMTLGVLDGNASVGGLAKNWVVSWIFNFVGALFVAYVLAFMGGIVAKDPFTAKAVAVATGKVIGKRRISGLTMVLA